MSTIQILLVEDNADDRYLTLRIFKKSGLPVEIATANDGVEAHEYIIDLINREERLPAVILLDLQLPRMGGIELLQRLRKYPATSELPVVILTASDNCRDQARCAELQAVGYMIKPLESSSIQKIFSLAGID